MAGALRVCLCSLLLCAASGRRSLLDDGVGAFQTEAFRKYLGQESLTLNTSSLIRDGFEMAGLDDGTAQSCFTSQFSGHSCYGGVACMVAKMCGSVACTTQKECTMTKKGTPKCHPKKCPLCDNFTTKKGKKIKKGSGCAKLKTKKTKDACEKHFKWCEGGGRVQKCLKEYGISMHDTSSDKGKEWGHLLANLEKKIPVPMSLAHCSGKKCSGHAVLVVAAAHNGGKRYLGLLDPWAPRVRVKSTKDFNGNTVNPDSKGIHWTPYRKTGAHGNKESSLDGSYKIPSGFEGTRAETYMIITTGCDPASSKCLEPVQAEVPPPDQMDNMDEDQEEADDDAEEPDLDDDDEDDD